MNKAVIYFASLQSSINVGVIFLTKYFILVHVTFGITTVYSNAHFGLLAAFTCRIFLHSEYFFPIEHSK